MSWGCCGHQLPQCGRPQVMPPLEPGHPREGVPLLPGPLDAGLYGISHSCHPSQVWSALPVSGGRLLGSDCPDLDQRGPGHIPHAKTCRSPKNLWAPGSSLFLIPSTKKPLDVCAGPVLGAGSIQGAAPALPDSELVQETVGTSGTQKESSGEEEHWGQGEGRPGEGSQVCRWVGWS